MSDGKKQQTITIKKGEGFELTVHRDQLINVDQTSDGIIFKFKHGLDLMCTHQQMPLTVKNLIIHSTQTFEKGSITIDLFDYVKPVKITL